MLLKSTTGKIPEGSVALTPTQATYYQWKQVRHWPNRWDVWPHLYGIPLLSLLSGYSGFKINHHYRIKLKLRQYGIGSTQLAMTMAPALFAAVPHFLFVSENIYLNHNQCLLCLQIRAVGIQLFASTVYPVMMSPIANFMFAVRHGTYPLPYWKDYIGTYKLWMSMNQSLLLKIKIIIPLHIIFAGFITYMEAKSLHTVRLKLENGEIDNLPEIEYKSFT